MSPLAMYRFYLGAFFACGFFWGLLVTYWHPAFAVPFFANVFFWSWLLQRPSCHRCHFPLAPPTGSSLLEIINSFRARSCRNCGSSVTAVQR
jgi:hypothetical protein